MNKLHLLALLGVFAVLPAHSESPPIAYQKAIKRQSSNKFNENDIISFVYHVYSLYDRHAPVDRFLPLLASKNLEMRFPETTLHSHADFKRWYAHIGKTIASNVHVLDRVKVEVLGNGRYQADIDGVWQAESTTGQYIAFKFRQRWTLMENRGKQPIIQTYEVEARQ